MDLYSILDRRSCSVELTSRDAKGIIGELAELAAKSEKTGDISADVIKKALMDREEQGSTGFGNEIAIPHARIEGLTEFLLYIGVAKRGVDFNALDKKKVRIFFGILGPPEGVNEHLKILAFVSRALGHTNLKNELIQSSSSIALAEAFLRNVDPSGAERREQRKMQLLIVNLYDEEMLYPVLEIFIEEGIEGATILESAGMGRYISNVPLFADFIGFMRQNKHQSKTIMALVPEEYTHEIIERIETTTGDMEKTQGAMVMVMDVPYFKGSMQML